MKKLLATADAPARRNKDSLRLGLRLLTCSTLIERRMRQRLAERFATTLPRFDVMAALYRKRGGMTMSELSEMLLVSNGNVTGVVARLVTDGLVDRIPDEKDRRFMRVELSNAGKTLFTAMAAEHEEWMAELMADLSDYEIQTLLLGVDRVRSSIGKSGK